MKRRLFTILLLAISLAGICQTKKNFTCGTPANFPDFAKNIDTAYIKKNADGIYRVKLYVVNFNYATTFNPGVEIPEAVALMNQLLHPHNICFELVGFRSVIEPSLYVFLEYLPEDVALLNQYKMANTLTMFLHSSIYGGPNKRIGGTAFAIPNTFFSLDASLLNTQAAAHEAGHCMGLFHTFHGNPGVETDANSCEEFVNRTNASSCGDFVADTRADSYGRPGARINNACQQIGDCFDSNGDQYTDIPSTNVMAYWWNENGNCNQDGFTPGQATRAKLSFTPLGGLFFQQLDQTNISLQNGQLTGNVVRGTVGIIQAGNLTGTGAYILNDAVGGFTANQIILKPGFRASVATANRNFVFRANTCQ